MGGLSLPHLLLVAVVVLIFFGGKGRISDIMGDVAKGIKSFKKGLSDDDAPAKPGAPNAAIEHQPTAPLESAPTRDVNKAG